MSQADEIKKWKELLDEGAISEEEFNKQKEKILSKNKRYDLNSKYFIYSI